MKNLELIYLATTYRANPDGIDAAFIEASSISARLLKEGYKVFSPIAHTHPIAVYGNLDPLADFWLDYDEAMMHVCNTLVVCDLPFWETSKGIAHEIAFFRKHDKPIYLMNPTTLHMEPM